MGLSRVNLGRLFALLPLVFAWTILVSCEGECFAQEIALKEHFLTEAKQQCEEYERFARRLQGTATMKVEIQNKEGKKEPVVNHFEFKQNPRCASFYLDSESSKRRVKTLSAVNPDYSFELKGADASSTWVVTTIEDPNSTLQRRRPLSEEVLAHIMPQYYFEDRISLASMLESPDFIVERVEPIPSNDRILARIAFQYRQQKKILDRDYIPVQGGTMLLDPDHHWCPLERTLNCKWSNGTGPVKEKFEYAEVGRGFYMLKRRSYIHQLIPNGSNSSDHWEPESVWEYDLHEAWHLPGDGEFTLSAYGLPEPPHLRRTTPWYLWALGAGGVCLVLGFLVHRRIRRGN